MFEIKAVHLIEKKIKIKYQDNKNQVKDIKFDYSNVDELIKYANGVKELAKEEIQSIKNGIEKEEINIIALHLVCNNNVIKYQVDDRIEKHNFRRNIKIKNYVQEHIAIIQAIVNDFEYEKLPEVDYDLSNKERTQNKNEIQRAKFKFLRDPDQPGQAEVIEEAKINFMPSREELIRISDGTIWVVDHVVPYPYEDEVDIFINPYFVLKDKKCEVI